MKYNPNVIEAKWQKYWAENQTFAAANNSEKALCVRYVSLSIRAGLHVGHRVILLLMCMI
jgi:leucyl-tRNA synthetase